VNDVANVGRKGTQVANAGQDAAIAALKGSTKIITSGTQLTSDGINAMAEQVKSASVLSKEGMGLATNGIAILNGVLSDKASMVGVIGGPIKMINTGMTALGSLLSIILTSPLGFITRKLEERGELKKIETEKKLEQERLNEANELEAMKQKAANDGELQKFKAQLDFERQKKKLIRDAEIEEEAEEQKKIEALKNLAAAIQPIQNKLTQAVDDEAHKMPEVNGAVAITTAADKALAAGGGRKGKQYVGGWNEEIDPEIIQAIKEGVQEDSEGILKKLEARNELNAAAPPAQSKGWLSGWFGGKKKTRRNRKQNKKKTKRTRKSKKTK
jgi:general stress protein YciG